MDKKIGKLILLIILNFIPSVSAIDLKLKAVDTQGELVSNIETGIPFYLKLTIEAEQNIQESQPIIENLNNFSSKFLGTSNSISNINGKVSILKEYQYEVTINKEGIFNIGPATIEVNSQQLKSNVLQIKTGIDDNQQKKLNKIFLELSINKNEVYLNEELELTVRFYTSIDQVKLLQIENPKLDDIYLDEFKLSTTDYKEIEGKEYYYTEYKTKLFSQKTGDLIIPAFKAIFEQVRNNSNFFSGFFNFNERKQVFSNSLKLKINPLPKNKNNVSAVGEFNKLTASVNLKSALQGEGIVYKLELNGQGNFHDINFTQLDLPSEFKFYESKNYLTQVNSNKSKKVFEFILQGLQAGEYTIPAQKFEYFDVKNKNYKILFSEPINIQIKPLEKLKQNNLNQDVQEIIVDEKQNNDDDFSEIFTKLDPPKSKFVISSFWIILILITTVFLNLILLFKEFIIKTFKKKPIQVLSARLKKVQTDKDLYQIFIDYFSGVFNVNNSEITKEFIEEKFKQLNIPNNIIYQWNVFFYKITESSYGYLKSNQNLKEEAFDWLHFFKTIKAL